MKTLLQLSRWNFHDARLIDFSLGPRRELALRLLVDPVWNEGQAIQLSVRFGAIRNFEEVAAFMGTLNRPHEKDRAIDEVLRFSKQSGTWEGVLLELSNAGAIEIHSSKLTIDPTE